MLDKQTHHDINNALWKGLIMSNSKLVPLEILGISNDARFTPVVLLRHEDRVLPILVGYYEHDAIRDGLAKRDLGRPMTHDLICNLLAGLRGILRSVVIYKLENDTFYAHLNIEQLAEDGQVEQVLRIDPRPSDGIAIACRVNCPIFASQDVMERASADWSVLSSSDDTETAGDSDDIDESGDPDADHDPDQDPDT